MKTLLLGGSGQVGHELSKSLAAFSRVVAPSRAELDLTDLSLVRAFARDSSPNIIVNAAAYNEVDQAEVDEAGAKRINTELVAALGEHCLNYRVALISYSTDFVFDGTLGRPYRETDAPHPLSAYGRAKLAGDKALEAMGAPALVLRTAWVYSLRRKSFVTSILRLLRERQSLSVVADQVGNPTHAGDLADATSQILRTLFVPKDERSANAWDQEDGFSQIMAHRGVVHLAGGGFTTRHAFACAIARHDPRKHEHRVEQILPIPSSELRLPAARPTFAPLDCTRARDLFGVELPPWEARLAAALNAAPSGVGQP